MQGLKKFGLVVSIIVFGPLFILSVVSFSFNRTLGDKEYTKQTITDARLYDAIGQTIQSEAVGSDLANADPLITTALQTAVSGDSLQSALEPLIDNTYGWLDGSAEQPEFSLAVDPIKANFQQNLTASLQQRAASLPVCPGFQPTSGTDIFTYNCIPRGTDVTALINDTVNRISTNASIFADEAAADGTISTEEARELGVSDPTQNLPDTLPNTFQFLAKGQWWFIIGAFLSAVGVVLLSKTALYGFRKLGILLVINGVGVLIVGFIFGFIISALTPNASVEVTESAVNALKQASRIILNDNAGMLKIIGLVALSLGVISIVVSSILLKNSRDNDMPKPPRIPKKTPGSTVKNPASKAAK